MNGVPVSLCASCGETSFPPRIWCPTCGSGEIADMVVELGTVEDATVLHRVVDRSASLPVAIGTVRLDTGARVVARLDGVSPGERARLRLVDHAVVAQPA